VRNRKSQSKSDGEWVRQFATLVAISTHIFVFGCKQCALDMQADLFFNVFALLELSLSHSNVNMP